MCLRYWCCRSFIRFFLRFFYVIIVCVRNVERNKYTQRKKQQKYQIEVRFSLFAFMLIFFLRASLFNETEKRVEKRKKQESSWMQKTECKPTMVGTSCISCYWKIVLFPFLYFSKWSWAHSLCVSATLRLLCTPPRMHMYYISLVNNKRFWISPTLCNSPVLVQLFHCVAVVERRCVPNFSFFQTIFCFMLFPRFWLLLLLFCLFSAPLLAKGKIPLDQGTRTT